MGPFFARAARCCGAIRYIYIREYEYSPWIKARCINTPSSVSSGIVYFISEDFFIRRVYKPQREPPTDVYCCL